MLSILDLNGCWKIRGFDGQNGSPEAYCAEAADERTFIEAQVPGEIHLDLERAGLIADCNVGTNARSARWVEEQVWVYRTRFNAPPDAVAQRAWLVFEGLDLNAVIYLNGEEVGRHANAFRPCRIDVTGKLRAGENSLAVRIESGLYLASEKPGTAYNPQIDHMLHKRSWLRKPQYSFSWDWNARLVNVGIWRPVRLEWTDSARIDAVTVFNELAEDHASARVRSRLFVENAAGQALDVLIRMRIVETGGVAEIEAELPAGFSRHDLSVELKNPKLWWPLPHGDQPLYDIEYEVLVGGKIVDCAKRRTGIRSVRINQDPHPEGGDYFILEVNGRKIFAKGGNWVPPDMIYARPDAEHYRRLVEMAVQANFNALRVWGGGVYADHALLDACDEMGVLIWHDFIFACSKYPADDADFLNDVRKEVEFVIRDLSPHPSLLIWCGNNELEWGAWEWGYDRVHPHPDHALFHLEIPRILRREDPSRPYWPSSPYSTDYRHPTDPTTGDQHPWFVTLQGGGTNFWEYRKDISRFPNEGGVLGASSPATLKRFLPDEDRRLWSPTWEFHDNSCNFWRDRGITYQYVEDWLGIRPEEMSFDDYCFYSALLQSEGLQEYINNFRRRMFGSSSAIFWMYNDSWPVSHGWTIVDYYLRRKLAYHPVRRAFAPVHVIPVIEEERVLVFGINDTPEKWEGEVRYGLFGVSGGLPIDRGAPVTLPPDAATLLGEMPFSEWRSVGLEKAGAFALLVKDGRTAAQNRIFAARYKDIEWSEPQISILRKKERAVFASPVFVWGVCLDIDGEAPLADDVFDLLPGMEYEIPWPTGKPLPEVQRCGSPLPRC